MNLEKEYKEDVKSIQPFNKSADLAGLTKLAEKIQEKWGKRDGQYYAALMLEVAQTFNSSNFGIRNSQEQHVLAQKYARLGLKVAGLPLQIEINLVLSLGNGYEMQEGQLEGLKWSKLRMGDARLWLQAWQRLQREIIPDFDFNQIVEMNPSPPPATGLQPGIAPQAIKDPELRAEYEAVLERNKEKAEQINQQYEVRRLNNFFSPHAERYFITAYSSPPYNTEELRQFLDFYGTDKESKVRILKGVDDAIKASADARKDTAPTTTLEDAENK